MSTLPGGVPAPHGVVNEILSLPRMQAKGHVERSMAVPYDAFCRDRWGVYCRYATACVGSTRIGAELARSALLELGLEWAAALRMPSPAAVAWDLLVTRTRGRHTEVVGRLYGLLHQSEADALLLRYKLGLSSQETAEVMGLDVNKIPLLHTRALRNVSVATGA